MKKPVLIFFALLLLAIISVYFVIPQKITINNSIQVDATDENVARFLVHKQPWIKWWPGGHSSTDQNLFTYNGTSFLLKKNTNSGMGITIEPNGVNLTGTITYLASSDDITRVTWDAEKLSPLNPVSRVTEYLKIKSAGKNIDSVLSHFKRFIQQDSNVYGIIVKPEKIIFPVVIATTTNTPSYPSVKTIYGLINNLKVQINAQRAKGLDSPMLNIHKLEHGYQVMVAIPVDKVLKPINGLVINKLPKGGNLLTTKLKGGFNTVDNAFNQLKAFQENKGLKSPAMPYASLLTNRLLETDTSKWVTKVYYPSY